MISAHWASLAAFRGIVRTSALSVVLNISPMRTYPVPYSIHSSAPVWYTMYLEDYKIQQFIIWRTLIQIFSFSILMCSV